MKVESRKFYVFDGVPYNNKSELLSHMISYNLANLCQNMDKDFYALSRKLTTNKEFRVQFKNCLIELEDLEFED